MNGASRTDAGPDARPMAGKTADFVGLAPSG
jgi:hypothetical protein